MRAGKPAGSVKLLFMLVYEKYSAVAVVDSPDSVTPSGRSNGGCKYQRLRMKKTPNPQNARE
jgi:hypothetical protein